MDKPEGKKSCFVIGPIGDPDTPTRDNADMLVDYVIRPVLEPLGYNVERADRISTPGTISDQVITRVLSVDLVIADLTDHNANAFYELALRHSADRAAIHMITRGQRIPFDVADGRAIHYSLKNPTVIGEVRSELEKQVKEIEKPGYQVSNPVSRARGIRSLSESSDSKERLFADLITSVQNLEARVKQAEDNGASVVAMRTPVVSEKSGFTRGSTKPMIAEDLNAFLEAIQAIEESKKLKKGR